MRFALALWLAAAPGPGPAVIQAPSPAEEKPVPLATAADVRRLCEALDFPERASPRQAGPGRAEAKARQEERRRGALERRYRAELAGKGLAFDYDQEGKRLLLTERARLVTIGGSLRVWPTEDPDMPAPADPTRARRIAAGARSGEVVLQLTFALPEDEEVAVCAHPPGTAQYTLGVEPVSWSYRIGAEVLARGGQEEPGEPAPGARPRVALGEPIGGNGAAIRRALERQVKDLASCYALARKARPALDGTLALELDLDPGGGRARNARVAMDSVHDEELSRCALSAVRGATFPGGPGGRVQVPVHFTMEGPEADQAQRQ
ncbi:MAG TPA: AgmX/PglI C-terminal domain-containing protein [Anaeromyxobacteraceae bacterium]|nr:AgmX/PglI C-terminal domain-containing protein [Anaeromyxobacteraceae bacterium]